MNYLEALTRRSVETVPLIRPRLPTLFEPVAGRPLDEALAAGPPAERLTEIAADASSGPMADVPRLLPPRQGRTPDGQSVPALSGQTPTPRSAPRRMKTDGRRSLARSLPMGLRGGDPGQAPASVFSVAEEPSLRSGLQIEPAPAAAHPVGVEAEASTGRTSVRPPADDGSRTSAPAVQPPQEAGMPSAGQVAVALSTSSAPRPAQTASAAEPGQVAPVSAPTVHIHIGRIEVRALPQPAPAPPAQPSRPAPRRQSLEEYLAGGGGRS